MREAYLDAAPSGSGLRALLRVTFEPTAAPMATITAPHGAWRDDLRFFSGAYLLAFVFFLLLLV